MPDKYTIFETLIVRLWRENQNGEQVSGSVLNLTTGKKQYFVGRISFINEIEKAFATIERYSEEGNE